MSYYYPYRRKKQVQNSSSDKSQADKDLRITTRFDDDPELYNDIIGLSGELNQHKSKIIKDILNDFFLTKKEREQKEDIEHLFA